MKIHLAILTLFGIICISPIVKAQQKDSYLVLTSEDTLYGKIKTDVSGRVKLKVVDGGGTIKYKQDELIGYYDARKDMVFITINPEDDNHGPWLYERKADGIIKLYSYIFEEVNGGRVPFYYVERENSGPRRILKGSVVSIKKEKDVLREFMYDNEDILSEIKRTGWNEKNVLRLINWYNSWYITEKNHNKTDQD
ncbi:MAG: hypothetical protein PVH48_02505 [Cyclobacteriaceae bacterium]|jgi:hypothetical protein